MTTSSTAHDSASSTGHKSAPPRAPRARLGLLPKLMLLGIVFAFCTGFLELGIRIAQPQPASWLSIYRPHPRLPFFALDASKFEVVDTGESRWEVYTDAQGFRVPKSKLGSQGKPLALWVGDSYTFGHGVSYEDSWVGRLAMSPARKHEHVNAGCPGYGPKQYADGLADMLAQGIKPSTVIVSTFLGNDFHDVIWDKNVFVRDGVVGDDGTLKAKLKIYSHLYRLLSKLKKSVGPPPKEVLSFTELEQPEAWKSGELAKADVRYRDELARVVSLCKQHGIELRMMVIPSIRMVDDYRKLGDPGDAEVADARLPIVHAHRALDALGVDYLDVTPELAKYPTFDSYLRYDQHFSPSGHELVAKLLAERFGL